MQSNLLSNLPFSCLSAKITGLHIQFQKSLLLSPKAPGTDLSDFLDPPNLFFFFLIIVVHSPLQGSCFNKLTLNTSQARQTYAF